MNVVKNKSTSLFEQTAAGPAASAAAATARLERRTPRNASHTNANRPSSARGALAH